MYTRVLSWIRRLVPPCVVALGCVPTPGASMPVAVGSNLGEVPMPFEANLGQTHGDVRFLARGAGYGVYLGAGEVVLALATPTPAHSTAAPTTAMLRLALVGADSSAAAAGCDELPGKANYFIGNDPAKWRTGIPTYARVRYRDVYPGIDLVYYGRQGQLEYDFVVAPGADPRRIALRFDGADRVEIDGQGDLVLHTAGGPIRQRKPVIYQVVDGTRHEIDGGYVLQAQRRVGFKIAAYERSQPLVIDPVVLSYATYLGGTGDDYGVGIAADANGN